MDDEVEAGAMAVGEFQSGWVMESSGGSEVVSSWAMEQDCSGKREAIL